MTATEHQRPMAPPLPALTPQAELALLLRVLHRDGYDSHLAGHATYRQPDGTILINPYGLTWDEVRASDIMRIDAEGTILDGPWTVTPALELHLEVHRCRHDITVAIHNHPRWATIWADAHRAPPMYDQSSAKVPWDPAVYMDYQGTVGERSNARACVEALGQGGMALLGNHGVLVVAPDIVQAHDRAVVLEWRARQAWHVEVLGGGVPIDPAVLRTFDQRTSTPGLWQAMVRRELRDDPGICE